MMIATPSGLHRRPSLWCRHATHLRIYVWSCGRGTPHVWLGSIRPQSPCGGGMLLAQWCYKHVLNCLINHFVATHLLEGPEEWDRVECREDLKNTQPEMIRAI